MVFGAGAVQIDHASPDLVAPGEIGRFALDVGEDAMGNAILVPVMIARGRQDGPVFGITAAMHGDELNGIRIVHKLLGSLDREQLQGVIIGCPVLNVPAYVARQRLMPEGFDLNRIMPGKADGNVAEVYAHSIMTRLVRGFDYLVDLHTASFGRENSLYVRANLEHPVALRMARLQHPEIIVHNEAADGTLRGAAMDLGIPSITVEAGNPHRFQSEMIRDSRLGLLHVLDDLGMLEAVDLPPLEPPVVCSRSFWHFARHGGLLEVLVDVSERVEAHQPIARIHDMFGALVATYEAPCASIVVGCSTSPVCQSGSRVAHLGVVRTTP